jgi:hypothetical protein
MFPPGNKRIPSHELYFGHRSGQLQECILMMCGKLRDLPVAAQKEVPFLSRGWQAPESERQCETIRSLTVAALMKHSC